MWWRYRFVGLRGAAARGLGRVPGRCGGATSSRSGASPASPNSRRLHRCVTSTAMPIAAQTGQEFGRVLDRHAEARSQRRRRDQRRGSQNIDGRGSARNCAVFQQEDGECRNYATAAIGHAQPGQAGTHAVVGSAAVGTALGAATGAAIGAAAGGAGLGAAIGAATGLVGGTAVGANNAAASEFDLQSHYDIAYTQCMYSLGDTVQSRPISGSMDLLMGTVILGDGAVRVSSELVSSGSAKVTSMITS